MITFEDRDNRVVLVYSSDWAPAAWLDDKLKQDGQVTLMHTFTVRPQDLLDQDPDDFEEVRRFVVGTALDDYRQIRSDVLGIEQDLLISRSLKLEKRTFVAERNISIFRRIDALAHEPIIIGGNRYSAIPQEEFLRLLHQFPNSGELTKYAQARVTRILRNYMETMSDADQSLARYMERRERQAESTQTASRPGVPIARELELEKFVYVRDLLIEMLAEADAYSEAQWQRTVADLFLLVLPQYVAVLHNVQITERYSNPTKPTDRYIDLMLIGADGYSDIIEIKKPFPRSLISKARYRDNHIPVRELSGAIMQSEKYLFYLSKSGVHGEQQITEKYAADLPAGLSVKIANPRAIILLGRDDDLTASERFDLEFVRRKYSNVVDIISYDDLLRRLEHIVEALRARVAAAVRPDTGQQR